MKNKRLCRLQQKKISKPKRCTLKSLLFILFYFLFPSSYWSRAQRSVLEECNRDNNTATQLLMENVDSSQVGSQSAENLNAGCFGAHSEDRTRQVNGGDRKQERWIKLSLFAFLCMHKNYPKSSSNLLRKGSVEKLFQTIIVSPVTDSSLNNQIWREIV